MENANEVCVAGTEQAGKASSCDGCPNQKACATGAVETAASQVKQNQIVF